MSRLVPTAQEVRRLQLFGLLLGVVWTVPVALVAGVVWLWFGHVPKWVWVVLVCSYLPAGILGSRWYSRRLFREPPPAAESSTLGKSPSL